MAQYQKKRFEVYCLKVEKIECKKNGVTKYGEKNECKNYVKLLGKCLKINGKRGTNKLEKGGNQNVEKWKIKIKLKKDNKVGKKKKILGKRKKKDKKKTWAWSN
ncbi:hypothetical protein RFI_20235 [Reticulomyxa filosa]|uniref:Uncharacterized protein n=1 Tax=Reticulomyxa filosa TaxID=46433 RepID=X6MSY6_RETFI|nr:hypothetical protein RFI_20235 [Reticulomyxa filosa]|eukprot:ETO17098.1 hypothetical protein RFI_20235 [Reticulomyxa filosa]